MIETFLIASVPLLGWAFWVERRLAAIQAIAEKLNSVDEKVERLVDHLLGSV